MSYILLPFYDIHFQDNKLLIHTNTAIGKHSQMHSLNSKSSSLSNIGRKRQC